MIGLRAEGPLQDEGDNDTLPASPDFARQTSEAELLDATVNLGVVSATMSHRVFLCRVCL